MGDRAGEGSAYTNLGVAYQSLMDYSKAIEYHEQGLAIAKEVGNRAGEGGAYGNLGVAYVTQGDYSKTIESQTQHLAIAKEVGDRAGESRAYANLGSVYQSLRHYSKASTTRRAWRLRRRGTGRGRAVHTGTSALARCT